jgi:hypothetical protein
MLDLIFSNINIKQKKKKKVPHCKNCQDPLKSGNSFIYIYIYIYLVKIFLDVENHHSRKEELCREFVEPFPCAIRCLEMHEHSLQSFLKTKL